MLIDPFSPVGDIDPSSHPGFLLWQGANEWERTVNIQLEKYGLHQAEYFHMVGIFWMRIEKKEVTQAALARFTRMTTMNVSKIVSRLEKRGYITRAISSDPRAKSLKLTELGMQIAMDAASNMGAAETAFFGDSTTADIMARYLSQIINPL